MSKLFVVWNQGAWIDMTSDGWESMAERQFKVR